LRDLVTEIEPSAKLLAQLDADLQAPGTSRAHRTVRSRRTALAGLLQAAGAVVAAVVLLFGSAATLSFAVVQGSGGTIAVTLGDIEGVAGANHTLHQLGINNNVDVVPVESNCPTRLTLTYTGIAAHHPTTVHLTPSNIAAGTTIAVAARQITGGEIEFGVGSVTGPAPKCAAPAAPSAGVGIP
jgi:hypothetical protein